MYCAVCVTGSSEGGGETVGEEEEDEEEVEEEFGVSSISSSIEGGVDSALSSSKGWLVLFSKDEFKVCDDLPPQATRVGVSKQSRAQSNARLDFIFFIIFS
jgi:hypothetical protein